jgi:RNA polymerase sigma-70 factor (TIGR02960 family)
MPSRRGCEDGAVSTELVDRARSGDEAAFEQLVGPYRRELHAHCYRILGSVADADDALQETLTAAWRGLPSFEGRASIRTWLYRVATSRCLNMVRSAKRRPSVAQPVLGVKPPEPTRLTDVVWLEPYPDVLLPDVPDDAAGPEARYELRESISLAFITALQLLPPRQRASLILRDVLGFSAKEVAVLLDSTEQSVASALKRARATLNREMPPLDRQAPVNSPDEQMLLTRLVEAFEASDVAGIVALMTDDVWVRMPPMPFEYQGPALAGRFLETVAFRQGRRYRFIPARANGQPAYGVYLHDPLTQVAQAFGLFVITIAGDRVSAVTRFENSVLPRFGLPRTIADRSAGPP